LDFIQIIPRQRCHDPNKQGKQIRGRYDAIATDDAKLIRLFRSAGIPFISPGLLIYSLYQKNIIRKITALNWLEKLSTFISEDEYNMIKFLLEKKP
jgi:hypothetical protein